MSNKTDTSPQEDPSPRQSNRFLFLMLIAGVFIIIDLLILLYFFWPGTKESATTQLQQKNSTMVKQLTTDQTAGHPLKKE